jgi:ADP-heptose:LPS heptosyltransferase
MGPFAAIRRHHASDKITLLTTAPYAPLATLSGYFDDIWIDARPPWWRLGAWLALKRRINAGGFARVYDLQTSRRSGRYFALLARPKPEWNGVAPGCSHPHNNRDRDSMHSIERQREQLGAAGVTDIAPPDFAWIDGDASAFGLKSGFVLLAPGGSARRPAKRWTQSGYTALAQSLAAQGRQPVLIGTGDEAARNAAIAQSCPHAVNLTGQTSLPDLARLARAAAGAIGNDNGPMHLMAAAGCPCVVLFSAASDPVLCAQRGPSVAILRRDDLHELSLSEVEAAMRLR